MKYEYLISYYNNKKIYLPLEDIEEITFSFLPNQNNVKIPISIIKFKDETVVQCQTEQFSEKIWNEYKNSKK